LSLSSCNETHSSVSQDLSRQAWCLGVQASVFVVTALL
jgi:hypothetical protein